MNRLLTVLTAVKTTQRCITLTKPGEAFMFFYRVDQIAEVLRVIGRYASDPELSLSWYDAARLSHEIRRRERAK